MEGVRRCVRGLEHQGFDEIIGVVYVNFRGIDGNWPNMFLPQDGSLIAVSERRGATLLYRGTAPWTHLQPLDSRGNAAFSPDGRSIVTADMKLVVMQFRKDTKSIETTLA